MLPDNLSEKIKFELFQLKKLIDSARPLSEKCRIKEPDFIEINAVGSLLHSFYTGIENIFILIAKNIDKKIPNDNKWHRSLLKSMTLKNESRNSVISNEMYDALEKYMDFRHLFRHAYSFALTWEKLNTLFNHLEDTFNNFHKEISSLLN